VSADACAAASLFDRSQLRPQAIAPDLSLELEGTLAGFAADEGEAQEAKALRFAKSALSAPVRRIATELDQSGFDRMKRAQELLNEGLPAHSRLVTDYHMPAMNGLELVAQLRDRRISIPAILVTSLADENLRHRAAAGGIPLIEKPVFGGRLWMLFARLLTDTRRLRHAGPIFMRPAANRNSAENPKELQSTAELKGQIARFLHKHRMTIGSQLRL
jgi:CheY-like chemotaxis protein